ncbi:MAG: tetratricopeptide repeat protein [Patescibacteria group bacterium]|nr:tetratricopeptide repeat protein [Patescibacteria group bacterium]
MRRIIKEYPDNEFVNFAREELGLKSVSLLQDSLRNLFMKAESLFFNVQDYDNAIKYYSILCDSFPYSEYAPQCRFIIGWFYENALVDRENALREYQKLADDYPQSLYAREIEPKLIAAKNPPPKLKEKNKDAKKRTLKRRRLFNEGQVKQ